MNYNIFQLRNYNLIIQAKFYSKVISKSEVNTPAIYESTPDENGLFPTPESFTSIVLWSRDNPIVLIVMDISVQNVSHLKLDIHISESYIINNELILSVKDEATPVEIIRYSDIDELKKLIKPKFSPYVSGEYIRITRKLVKSSDYPQVVELGDSDNAFIIPVGSKLYAQSYLRGSTLCYDLNNSWEHPIVIEQMTGNAFYVEDLIPSLDDYEMFVMYGYRLITRIGDKIFIYDLRNPENYRILVSEMNCIQFIDLDTIGGYDPVKKGFMILDLNTLESGILDRHDLMNFRVTIDNNETPWYYHEGVFYDYDGNAI